MAILETNITINAKDLPEVRAMLDLASELLKAARAGKAYRDAIASCANDPTRMSSYCTAEGDDLDALWAQWEALSDAALTHAAALGVQETFPCSCGIGAGVYCHRKKRHATEADAHAARADGVDTSHGGRDA